MATNSEVQILADGVALPGNLCVPTGCKAVVAFAHGSGSSRHSSRNQFVAQVLNDAGIGTLLFDLLTEPEAANRDNVFDVALLADRLSAAIDFLTSYAQTKGLAIGLFGASTGAAAALIASVESPTTPFALVSRGGRPDLAGQFLGQVTVPTLLIVGSLDTDVLELNRAAAAQLACEWQLQLVEGATHLFEEPGTLEIAANLACEWFNSHLST